jgi:hypothetical protein
VIALPAFVTARMLLIGGAILVILIGLWAWGEKREDDGRAEVQAAWDDERATLISAAADAQAKQRAVEQEFNRARQEATDAQANERRRNARAVAELSADRDRLRNDIEAYAAGGGASASGAAPACNERAANLGRALDDALQSHAACVGTAADLAADVRALRSAWPREVTP